MSDSGEAVTGTGFRPFFWVDGQLRVREWPELTARALAVPAAEAIGRRCSEVLRGCFTGREPPCAACRNDVPRRSATSSARPDRAAGCAAAGGARRRAGAGVGAAVAPRIRRCRTREHRAPAGARCAGGAPGFDRGNAGVAASRLRGGRLRIVPARRQRSRGVPGRLRRTRPRRIHADHAHAAGYGLSGPGHAGAAPAVHQPPAAGRTAAARGCASLRHPLADRRAAGQWRTGARLSGAGLARRAGADGLGAALAAGPEGADPAGDSAAACSLARARRAAAGTRGPLPRRLAGACRWRDAAALGVRPAQGGRTAAAPGAGAWTPAGARTAGGSVVAGRRA